MQKIVKVIQETRFCLSLYWAALCFYFINQPRALYVVCDKVFTTSVTW